MIENQSKCEVASRFDWLAARREEWIARNRYYYDDQKRYYRFLVPENASVIELGCGTGDLLSGLKPSRGVGIDISSEMVSIAARKYPELEFRQADIEKFHPWEETFDFIVLADVVGHLQDIEESFRRVRSFCRPDTRVVISYYNFL
ncbi:MAG: class I SAM-dependent methyltransferase, partial [Desulfobacterales bacterium]|nr:class I SAM-dependent methyltransferase [Desulfobacterales bacterium]